MAIVKKYKWPIILAGLTILKLVICSLLPMFYIEANIYDDKLMINLTESISNGEWLGNYNSFNLVKGMFFPLLLSFFRFINIPTGLALSLIYVLACFCFCYILRDRFTNKNILYILYLLLLFNPISFASETFERLYRYIIGPAQMLFFIAFLYGIYKNLGNKIRKIIPHLCGLGLTVATIVMTREDYLFVTVLLIVCFVIFIYKLKKSSYILLIAILVMLIPILTVKAINYKYYGKFILNELTETSYKEAYMNILRIKPDENIYRVSIPKSTIDKVLEVSPTFSTLKEAIEALYETEEEIIDGYIIWDLRVLQYQMNPNQTLEEVDEFWSKVSAEIEEAFDNGTLEKRIILPSMYMSAPTFDNIILTFKRLPQTIKYILTYEDVMTFDYDNLADSPNSKIMTLPDDYSNYSEYYSLLIFDIENTENVGTLSYEGVGGLCNIITAVYRVISFVINICGLLSFIILIVKKQYKKLFLPSIILLCISLMVIGITYTDASAFEAIRYFYLAPVYSLLIAFSIISINDLLRGVKNGKIRFNNFNAMLKRRKQSCCKHSKSS